MKESFSTDPVEWHQDLTFNTYVPITCDDVLHLHSFNAAVKFHNLPIPRTLPEQYFFGNHPINRVQVAGRVVYTEYREQVALSLFRIADGFGNSSLPCVIKSSPTFVATRPLKKGDLVVVLGRVSTFGDEIQVKVISVMSFASPNMLRYYVLREEAVQVRKHVLERSADEFKGAIRADAPPKVLTRLEVAELTTLRHAITARATDWGLELSSLLEKPVFEWP